MFREIIAKTARLLMKHKIPYVIIGGQAVLVHGEPRLTRDIDISLGVGAGRLKDILEILMETGLRAIPGDIENFVRQTMILPAVDESTGIRVDFIFSNSLFEAEAISRAIKKKVRGQEALFASPEDLVIHKIVAGREVDLKDVSSVILKNSKIDREHIRKWLGMFDETFQGKDFLKTFETILEKIEQK